MPFIHMDLQHPIDQEIRDRLKAMEGLNQVAFAAAIGRSQGWLNKFMNGAGNATIDDIIRIAAVLIGAERPAISESERRVLKALRGVPEERRGDAAVVMETAAKGYRLAQHPKSDGPAVRTPPATAHKGRGKR